MQLCKEMVSELNASKPLATRFHCKESSVVLPSVSRATRAPSNNHHPSDPNPRPPASCEPPTRTARTEEDTDQHRDAAGAPPGPNSGWKKEDTDHSWDATGTPQ